MAIEEKDITRSLIKSQQQQLNTISRIYDEICGIKSELFAVKDDVNLKFTHMQSMVKRVEDSVYIYYEEQKQLQSIVGEQANNLAQSYYNQDHIPWEEREDFGAEIRELAGWAMRKQWKSLKDCFKVTRYSSIRRVDFEDAVHFLKDFPMGGPFLAEFEREKEQRRKKQEREGKTP